MSTRSFRTDGSNSGWRLGAALLAAWVVAAPAGQAQASAGNPNAQPGKKMKPSVFSPPGSGTGGIYKPPNDAGAPPGGDGDGGEGGPGGGSGTAGKAASNGSRTEPAAAGASGGVTSRGGEALRGAASGAPAILLEDDQWNSWWEANKFDFIELRRIEDPMRTGQGLEPETPAQHELRLAANRLKVREQILPVLRSLTRSNDSAVRSAAIVALGKLHDESSIDLVRNSLADGSLDVRRASMLSLGVLESGRASWLLMNIADDSRAGRSLVSSSPIAVDDRGTALIAAALRGDLATEPLLLQMLTERDGMHPELLSMAADAAGLMGSSEAIRPLIDIAFEKQLPQGVRSAAVGALGRIGDPSVTPALMELLDDDLDPRRAATVALGLVGHAGAARVIDRLGDMLEHETDAVARHFAAISLGRISGDMARSRLLAAFAKPRDDMRPWLALSLGICERTAPSGTIAPVLLERFQKDENLDSRAACLIAIGLCHTDHGMAQLVESVKHDRIDLAGAAAMGLGLSGQSAAAGPLRDALAGATNADVLRQAALALGILGDSASIPALLELIRTTNNPFVASYAAIGVAFMGDADAAGPLLDLIQRQGPLGVTTTYAVAAVGQLFDADRRPALSRLSAGDNYLSRPVAVNDLLDLGF